MGNMTYGIGTHVFTLATGSPGKLGLLAVRAEAFCSQHDARRHWIESGIGESLCLLCEKRVDIALVHAPGKVERAVAEGWASLPTLSGTTAIACPARATIRPPCSKPKMGSMLSGASPALAKSSSCAATIPAPITRNSNCERLPAR